MVLRSLLTASRYPFLKERDLTLSCYELTSNFKYALLLNYYFSGTLSFFDGGYDTGLENVI